MEYKALKDIAKITMGQSPDSSSYNEEKEGLPFFQGNADFGELYPNERVWCNEPKKVAEPGDILISVRAPIGALNYVKDKCCIGRGLAAINIEDEAERNYVFHLLKARNNDLNQKGTGSTFKAIGKNVLEEVAVPQISRDEQQKCMDMMDLLESIIRERKSQLDKLDELIKARFVELFGNGHDGVCKTERLGDFCKFQQGTQVPVEDQIEEKKEGYTRFLRIVDYTQAPQEPRYVSVKGREITEDSVVIVRYGATAGFVGHGYSGILANNLFEVVPDEAVLSKDFLYLALKYGTFEKEVHDKAFGAAMPALSFGMMNDIGVVTPDSSEQSGFVEFAKQVDKSKFIWHKGE